MLLPGLLLLSRGAALPLVGSAPGWQLQLLAPAGGPACTPKGLPVCLTLLGRHSSTHLVHSGLDVAGVSGGHGLQSNGVLAADLHRAHLQLQIGKVMAGLGA